jgi:hypothetical protein
MDLTLIDRINSATAYPSILTYHGMGDRGALTEELTEPFADVDPETPVRLTEKINGTNFGVTLFPDGDYLIRSRSEILYAKDDRVVNPALGIVTTVRPFADALVKGHGGSMPGEMCTVYGEVYGGGIGGQAKQYTSSGQVSFRLFDYNTVPLDILKLERKKIASWRENGGQRWADSLSLEMLARDYDAETVPFLTLTRAGDLPKTVEDALAFLTAHIPSTRVALDGGAIGRSEGLVIRTANRAQIAKLRFEDYERTLKRRSNKK